jgi:hypothetical protein
MVEKLLAAAGLAVCVALLLGLLLGRLRVLRLRAWFRYAWAWPQRRQTARREARSAIERARRAVERDGNVYRPKSFNGKPPDDKLH